jgi:hypothetical protein
MPVQPGRDGLPEHSILPVLLPLRDLLPGGGLRRGSVVAVGRWGLLCLALSAAASAEGAWCAAIGLPWLGVAAAAGVGLDPGRLLLIAEPGPRWPQVVATLLDGCELVLLQPPSPPAAQTRRRIEATARRHGSVLMVAGDWEGAHVRLSVASQQWLGAGLGHGRLAARRAQVIAYRRGVAVQQRSVWLWLPGPDGMVAVADEPEAAVGDRPGVVNPVAAVGEPAAAVAGQPVVSQPAAGQPVIASAG